MDCLIEEYHRLINCYLETYDPTILFPVISDLKSRSYVVDFIKEFDNIYENRLNKVLNESDCVVEEINFVPRSIDYILNSYDWGHNHSYPKVWDLALDDFIDNPDIF